MKIQALGLEWTVEVVGDSEVDSRRRTRTCSLSRVAEQAAAATRGNALPGWSVDHGGSVANSYGYSATTQVVAAIADRASLTVWVWRSSAAANKVTLRGAAAASGAPYCVSVLEDGRVADARIREARLALLDWVATARTSESEPLEIKGRLHPHLLSDREAVAYDAILEAAT
jgi:hypothetical protein